jgi:hypothetical protein
MKKNVILLLILLLWASPAAAQYAPGAKPAAASGAGTIVETPEILDVDISALYRSMSVDKNIRAAEYEHVKNTGGGGLVLEWDPLPHRFKLETAVLNNKDYFGEMDYAFKDLVLVNINARGLHHNLEHYNIGQDDTSTASPSMTDKDPNALYAVDSRRQKGSIRLKTPNYPFHVYAEAQNADREGTVQQRFLRGYTGQLDKVSQSRELDGNVQEVRVGANSHLGYIEVDYSHAEKRFEAHGDKTLFDHYTAPAADIPHNIMPDLKSSSDTVKIHTTFSGRFVAAATYSGGVRKNQDSDAKTDYWNAAGDITITPVASTVFFFKYRHYDLTADSPATVTALAPAGTTVFSVRDSLSSARDVLSGTVRYRPTARLTLKADYVVDSIVRDAGMDSWDVAHRTVKSTGKAGISYRIMNTLMARVDYSATGVTDPAYTADPDHIDAAKASVTWQPAKSISTLLSYSGTREKRDDLSAPLAGGSRKVNRDQALGSVTFLVAKRTTLTASVLYLKNKTDQTITYRDAAGMYLLEDGVPYADESKVVALSATHAVSDVLLLSAEGSQSLSDGKFRNDGSIANTTGIDSFSDMKVVENIYAAGAEVQLSRTVKGELRYQTRRYDDRIDDTQDGKLNTVLATVSMKW